MADETTRTATWLYTVLTGDSDLAELVATDDFSGVYDTLAPEGAPYPRVVFQWQAPAQTVTHNASRVMTRDLWLVRGIAGPTPVPRYTGDLTTIADLIDEALHRASGGPADDGLVLTAVRTQTFRMVEGPTDGHVYSHLGGIYRVFTQIP